MIFLALVLAMAGLLQEYSQMISIKFPKIPEKAELIKLAFSSNFISIL